MSSHIIKQIIIKLCESIFLHNLLDIWTDPCFLTYHKRVVQYYIFHYSFCEASRYLCCSTMRGFLDHRFWIESKKKLEFNFRFRKVKSSWFALCFTAINFNCFLIRYNWGWFYFCWFWSYGNDPFQITLAEVVSIKT